MPGRISDGACLVVLFRPLGDAERTDELAQSLGQPYVHLGMNMPAVALHDANVASPEDVIIWFGIIDILQARVPMDLESHDLTPQQVS
jgi:hypothetical protein